ncbi:MAG: restriction endonuclease subunit S [Actinobacteria bacterium]|nr:restriction endonuclease subunit S [Actinomycetota bacterium]
MSTFPASWREVTLNDLQADVPRAITDGPFGSNLTSAHYTGEGPRVVRLQNIGDGVFNNSEAHISQQHFEGLRAHEVQADDLLIASLGNDPPRACLTPAWLGPAIVKADCIRVRLSTIVDPRWALYAMQTPAARQWAADRMYGVGRPRLGLKTIRAIPIPLPPMDEQARILGMLDDHLSRLDNAQSLLSASLLRTRALARAALQALIPTIPHPGWVMATVGEAGDLKLGRQRHPDWHNGPEMRPYLRVANVFEDRIDTSDIMQMDFSGVFERFKLIPGDVLLNEGQSPELLGRPAMYRGVPPEVAFTNTLIRFRAGPQVLPEWALLVFRRHMHSGRFMRESRITTNIGHLSLTRLKGVEFPIPPLEVQRHIVGLASGQLSAVGRLRSEIAAVEKRLNVLRREALSAAFSGRMASPDPSPNEVARQELASV